MHFSQLFKTNDSHLGQDVTILIDDRWDDQRLYIPAHARDTGERNECMTDSHWQVLTQDIIDEITTRKAISGTSSSSSSIVLALYLKERIRVYSVSAVRISSSVD